MTSSAQWHEEQCKIFEKACRQAGLRLTFQRLAVYRELAGADDHPSAETLHQRLRRSIPSISLDTVYRTLATLASHGLINKIDTIESQARFETTGARHHHLICSRCKEIIDFTWHAVDHAVLPDEVGHWGRIESKNVVVYGVCSKCLALP
jgi:Fur family transcriptional regulator, peroxide stress response regulator